MSGVFLLVLRCVFVGGVGGVAVVVVVEEEEKNIPNKRVHKI